MQRIGVGILAGVLFFTGLSIASAKTISSTIFSTRPFTGTYTMSMGSEQGTLTLQAEKSQLVHFHFDNLWVSNPQTGAVNIGDLQGEAKINGQIATYQGLGFNHQPYKITFTSFLPNMIDVHVVSLTQTTLEDESVTLGLGQNVMLDGRYVRKPLSSSIKIADEFVFAYEHLFIEAVNQRNFQLVAPELLQFQTYPFYTQSNKIVDSPLYREQQNFIAQAKKTNLKEQLINFQIVKTVSKSNGLVEVTTREQIAYSQGHQSMRSHSYLWVYQVQTSGPNLGIENMSRSTPIAIAQAVKQDRSSYQTFLQKS